jgi:hypothetical protein
MPEVLPISRFSDVPIVSDDEQQYEVLSDFFENGSGNGNLERDDDVI